MPHKGIINENKPMAQLSFLEMKDSLSTIDRCKKLISEIDIKTIKTGNEAILLSASQKMESLLTDLFGNNTHQYNQYKAFSNLKFSTFNDCEPNLVRKFVKDKIDHALVTLDTIKNTFIEKLDKSDLLGTSEHTIKAYEGMDLHPEISKVTSNLFSNGHYSNAIEDATKALNNLVRLRSGLLEDGVSLMQKAFSEKNPILKFNDLVDESDLNEQKGFMQLFSGTVTGLRNPRAHKIIIDDPEMTLEFIAFISLLAKLLDKTKPVPPGS